MEPSSATQISNVFQARADLSNRSVIKNEPLLSTSAVDVRVVVLSIITNHATKLVNDAARNVLEDLSQSDLRADEFHCVVDLLVCRVWSLPNQTQRKHSWKVEQTLRDGTLGFAFLLVCATPSIDRVNSLQHRREGESRSSCPSVPQSSGVGVEDEKVRDERV